MSAGTDHDLKVLTERVEMHGDTLSDLDCLTVKQSRAIDGLTRRLAELERRAAEPTKHEREEPPVVDDEDNQSTAVGLTALEIADLPVGSVVEDKEGRLWNRGDDGDWCSRFSDGIKRHGWLVLHKLHGPVVPAPNYLSVDDLLTARFDVPVVDKHGDRWTRVRHSQQLWRSEHRPLKYVNARDLIPGYGPIRDADPELSARRPRARLTPAELDAMPTWARVEDHVGNTWDRGDDGKWHRRVTEKAPPVTAHMSSSLTMLRGPIFPSEDFIAVPHPRVPPMRFDRAKFPKPCDMAAGSTVTDRYGWQWTKQADPPGTWKAGANVVTDGLLEKVFGPFSAATEPARRIYTDVSLRNLNVGARVRSQNGVVWEKQDDGRWTSDVPLQGRTSGMLWVGHGPVFTLVRE